MGVKPLASMPEPQINERMERLKQDVREIIDNRIRVCEITDPPYPQSTMRERLEKATRIVTWEWANKTGKGGMFYAKDFFKVESRKIDGTVRWYVRFDVDMWEREVSGDD